MFSFVKALTPCESFAYRSMIESILFSMSTVSFWISFMERKNSNILTPEALKKFDEFKEKFNSSSLSAEALAEQMENHVEWYFYFGCAII